MLLCTARCGDTGGADAADVIEEGGVFYFSSQRQIDLVGKQEVVEVGFELQPARQGHAGLIQGQVDIRTGAKVSFGSGTVDEDRLYFGIPAEDVNHCGNGMIGQTEMVPLQPIPPAGGPSVFLPPGAYPCGSSAY